MGHKGLKTGSSNLTLVVFWMQIMKQIEMKRREKDRHHYVKKLRQMYQLALSNTASAQR